MVTQRHHNDDMSFTKRNFLRKIASLFDPPGFFCPFIAKSTVSIHPELDGISL